MTTLVLELPDEQFQQLSEEAERMGLTLHDFAVLCVLASLPSENQAAAVPSFEEAADYVFQKNKELYERLAGRKERVSKAISRIISKNEELYRRLA